MLLLLLIMGLINISCQKSDKGNQSQQQEKKTAEVKNHQKKIRHTTDSTTSQYKRTPAPELYEEFLKLPTPKELKIPIDKRGWGTWQEIVSSKKFTLASAIMESGDKATLAKIWQEFPSLSVEDQLIVSLVAGYSHDIDQVAAIVALAPEAKSDEVREELYHKASCIVSHALRDQKRVDAAMPIAEQLISSGVAFEFVIEEMKKLEQK